MLEAPPQVAGKIWSSHLYKSVARVDRLVESGKLKLDHLDTVRGIAT